MKSPLEDFLPGLLSLTASYLVRRVPVLAGRPDVALWCLTRVRLSLMTSRFTRVIKYVECHTVDGYGPVCHSRDVMALCARR